MLLKSIIIILLCIWILELFALFILWLSHRQITEISTRLSVKTVPSHASHMLTFGHKNAHNSIEKEAGICN